MKTIAPFFLSLLFTPLLVADEARAQVGVSALADCPLDAFEFDNPTLLDTPPLRSSTSR